MTYTAASHLGANKTIWLPFSGHVAQLVPAISADMNKTILQSVTNILI